MWKKIHVPITLDEITEGPPPPEDVRVVFDDGSFIPLECVYVGANETSGCRTWRNCAPVFMTAEMLALRPRISYKALPANTEISFSWSVQL